MVVFKLLKVENLKTPDAKYTFVYSNPLVFGNNNERQFTFWATETAFSYHASGDIDEMTFEKFIKQWTKQLSELVNSRISDIADVPEIIQVNN